VRLQRQDRTGAVQRLDIAFLVDREHDRFGRRQQVEADDVAEFLDKARVVRAFEMLDAVRLQPVLMPDAPDHRLADPRGLGHRACRPVGGVRRRRAQRHLDNSGDPLGRYGFAPGWACRIAQQALHPFRHIPLRPQSDAHATEAEGPRDVRGLRAIDQHQHDARTLRGFLRRPPLGDQRFELGPVRARADQTVRGLKHAQPYQAASRKYSDLCTEPSYAGH